MKGLFEKDPFFAVRHRDRRGRFATVDRAACDKAVSENKWLRLEVEKYRRIAEACTRSSIAQDKAVREYKREIADLRQELAQLKKTSKC